MDNGDIYRMWVQLVHRIGVETYPEEVWKEHYIEFWNSMKSESTPSILMDTKEAILAICGLAEEAEETMPLAHFQKRMRADTNVASVSACPPVATSPKKTRKPATKQSAKKGAAIALENVFETTQSEQPSIAPPLDNSTPKAASAKRGRPRLAKNNPPKAQQQKQSAMKKNTKNQTQNEVQEVLEEQPSEITTAEASKLPNKKKQKPQKKTKDVTNDKQINEPDSETVVERRVTRSQMKLMNASTLPVEPPQPAVNTNKPKRANLRSKAMCASNAKTAHSNPTAVDLTCNAVDEPSSAVVNSEYVGLTSSQQTPTVDNAKNLSLPKLKSSAEQELDEFFDDYKCKDPGDFAHVTLPMSQDEKSNFEIQDMYIEEAMLLVDPLASCPDISKLLEDDIEDGFTDDIPGIDEIELCLSSLNKKTLTEIDHEIGDTSQFFDNLPSLSINLNKTPLEEDAQIENELDYEDDDIDNTNSNNDNDNKDADDYEDDDIDNTNSNNDNDNKDADDYDDDDDDIDAISVATSWNGDDEFLCFKKPRTFNKQQTLTESVVQEKSSANLTKSKSAKSDIIINRAPKNVAEVAKKAAAQKQKPDIVINKEPTKSLVNQKQQPMQQTKENLSPSIPKKVVEVSVNPFVLQPKPVEMQQSRAESGQKNMPQKKTWFSSPAKDKFNGKRVELQQESANNQQPTDQTDKGQILQDKPHIVSIEQRRSMRLRNAAIQPQATNGYNAAPKQVVGSSVSPFNQQPVQAQNVWAPMPNGNQQNICSNVQPIQGDIQTQKTKPLFGPPIRRAPQLEVPFNVSVPPPMHPTFGIVCWTNLKGLCPYLCNHSLFSPGEVERRLNQQRYNLLMENYSLMKSNGILFKTYFMIFADIFFRRGMFIELFGMVQDLSLYMQFCAPFIQQVYQLLIRSGVSVERAVAEFMEHLWQPGVAHTCPEIFDHMLQILETADWHNYTKQLEELFNVANFPIPYNFLVSITQDAINKKERGWVRKIINMISYANCANNNNNKVLHCAMALIVNWQCEDAVNVSSNQNNEMENTETN